MSETYSLAEAAIKIIQDRRSIRCYTDEPVADEFEMSLQQGISNAPMPFVRSDSMQEGEPIG